MASQAALVLGLLFWAWGSAATAFGDDLNLLPPTTGPAAVFVDPELTRSVAPPPAQLPEPPPRVRLPRVVADAKQWRGPQCGVTEPRFAVFRHADKWRTFWKTGMRPYLPPQLAPAPPVDFSKEMVVGVFMGEKPIPNYEIEILSIRKESLPGRPPALVVRYRDIAKMSGVFVPPFAVQPFHLEKVPAYDGPVLFLAARR